MKIISNITGHLKNNWAKYLTKGAGLTAVGMIACDAHNLGLLQSDMYASEKDAAATGYYLNNANYLTDMSLITNKVKSTAYQMELDQGWRRFFNLGIGYVKGFGSMLISHVIPLGLGLGALLGKGKTGKLSAGALGIYAGCQLIKNFFGIGVPRGPLE